MNTIHCIPTLRSHIISWLRDYDRIQALAVALIYVQIGCALVGSLGALYNGVLLINLIVALFALIAIESSSQSLGRTYAVLLVCTILLDIVWFILFSHEIWSISSKKYGPLLIFSVRLALWMQIIGFSVRLMSSLLWIQMYRLGASSIDSTIYQEAERDLRNSFLNPPNHTYGPAIVRQNSQSSDILGGSIYDPAYYSSLFQGAEDNGYAYRSWTSFAPQKTTAKRMFQEERSKARTEKPSFKITRNVFNSKIEEGPGFTWLENDTGRASSLVLQSVNKDQPNIKTVNRDNSKPTFQSSETSSVSLFKWAKDHSGAPQIGQSNSPVKEGQRAHLQPMSSSVTISNNAKAITAGSSSIRHNPATQTNLFTIQAGPASETKSTVQSETPILNQIFSSTSSTTLPRKTLPHKETVNLIPQTNEMLNMKITQSILSPAPTFSTFNHQSSSQSSLSIPESSHPSLSSVALGGPSSRYKSKDRNQTASASSSVPYSSFSSTTASLVSPAAPSSVSPTALSSVSQTASSTFHFHFHFHSQASLPIHPPSKYAEPVGPHSHTKSAVSEIISSTEPSLSLTPETKVTAFSVSLPTSASTTSSSKPERVSPTSSEATTSSFNISSAASSASITSGAVSAVVAGSFSGTKPSSVTSVSTFNMFGTAFNSSFNSLPAQISSGQVLFASPPSGTITETKIDGSSVAISQEDEMEEEAPDTTALSMAALGGFGLGSAPAQIAPKSNPFGGPFAAAATTPTSSPFSLTAPSGELFRPASFGFQSLSPPQSSQPINQGVFSSGFGANNSAPLNVSGFGQPAQIGAGRQALGSVLGAFGQSRQLGTGLQGVGFATPSGFAAGGGGFANTATGGGFAGLSSTSGSFAGIGSGGGGFAAAAVPGGGGFAGASLAPAAGGFSAFGSNPGAGGFSSFGGTNTAAAGKPPQLFTQMRK